MLYIGSYTKKVPKGIYAFRFDGNMRRYVPAEGGEEVPNPSYLIASSDRRFLYSVSESEEFNGWHGGGIMSFERNEDGTIIKIDERGTGCTNPCHLCIDRGGKRLFAANYSEGAWNYYPVEDGRFLADATIVKHHGSSVNPNRQERAHVHFVMLSGDEKYLWTVDLGKDQLLIYRILEEGVPETEPARIFRMEPGRGPRHLVRHPELSVMYVINELDSCITVLGLDEEELPSEVLQEINLLPEGFSGENTAGAVKISGDGRFVYATCRGADCIVVLEADASGTLKVIQQIASGGKTPRDLTIAPSGNFLYCANQDSDLAAGFTVDRNTGLLTRESDMDLVVSMPVCVLFVE